MRYIEPHYQVKMITDPKNLKLSNESLTYEI